MSYLRTPIWTNEWHRIALFSLIILTSTILESCGRESRTTDTSTVKQSTNVISTPRIQSVSGSAMVLETSTRSAQQINMAGIIPFSKKNAVSTNGESLDSSSAQGIIINQFWITSTKLSQSEIFAIISAKLALNPIAYRSEMYGYLIELDIKSQDAISQLDILKTDKRLSIFNRSFTGGKVEKAL